MSGIQVGDTVAVNVGARTGGTRQYNCKVTGLDGDFFVLETSKGKTLRRKASVVSPAVPEPPAAA